MATILNPVQLSELVKVLNHTLSGHDIVVHNSSTPVEERSNDHLLQSFLAAKRIEGCSNKSLTYYDSTIRQLLKTLSKPILQIDTDNLRSYLAAYQKERNSSKVTIDNIRRIFSSFFSWLEDEDHIVKSPVRRIHKVKTDRPIKETFSDESLEHLRDACAEPRDLAIIDLLASTGMRVGELVRLNREDINFHERECIVFGKGNAERLVYFDARTKIHLQNYLASRSDSNPALFTALKAPHDRLLCGGIESRLRQIGQRLIRRRCIPINFAERLPLERLIKVCRLSRYNAYSVMLKLIPPCITPW